jgi:hypothetical protein
MIKRSAFALAAMLAAPAVAQPLPPLTLTEALVDYGRGENWLCLPGRKDVCSTPLAVTDLNPAGYALPQPSAVAADPKVDCFYVYPTVSRDQGMNSDLTVQEERFTAQAQFARFAGVCRPFAPVYRQMTTAAVTAAMAGGDVTRAYSVAYRDVVTAWKQFLATRNAGRPFVLVGHSQGSLMLQGLIAREIEGRPEARRMLLAIIPGFNVIVPVNKRVGGTFRSTPLCSRPRERGCVITYVTYREGQAPSAGARFGLADRPGFTVGCVNPVRPGSTRWEVADSLWPSRSSGPAVGGPIAWSSSGPPPSAFLRTPGLVSVRCVNAGSAGFLALHTNADPSDRRTDRVGGEPGINTPLGPIFLPGWGMHLADLQHAQGDLIRAVAAASPR